MLAGAIVPEGDGVRPPDKPALVFRDRRLRIKMGQKPVAFLARQAIDLLGEARVDIERPAARFGVGADDRMGLHRILGPQRVGVHAQAPAEHPGDVVLRRQGTDPVLHGRGQSVIGGVHVREEGVAPVGRDLDGPQDRAQGRRLAPCHIRVPVVLPAL